MNGLDSPLEGLSRARSSFERAADKIAGSSLVNPQNPQQDQVSLSDAMVALLNARNDYEANLKSLRTSNEMTRKLLDLLG